MRIGWVSPFAPDEQKGGWQGMNRQLLRALQRRGHPVSILAPVPRGRDRRARWASWILTAATGRRLLWSASDRALKQTARAFARRAAESPADVYLFFGSGDFLAVTPPAPYACFVDSALVPFLEWYAADRRYTPGEMRRLERSEGAWLRGARTVFTSSRFAARAILDRYGLAADRVLPVGAGPNLDDPPARPPPRAAVPRTVLFVGADFERKGGDRAVEAVGLARQILPDLTLDILGAPPPPPFRRDYVRVWGWVDRSQRAGRESFDRRMADSALFLTLPRADLTPAAVCEAAAYGLPTLATAVGGLPEMIRDGVSGWLMPPESDAEKIARLLVELFRDPDRLARAGQAAREDFERVWNWDAVAATIVSRLLEGVGRSDPAPDRRT